MKAIIGKQYTDCVRVSNAPQILSSTCLLLIALRHRSCGFARIILSCIFVIRDEWRRRNWAFTFVPNSCIKSNHRCRNRSRYDEKVSKPKTEERFATHFSISLHFTSAGITVLRIDLQVGWTRASQHGPFVKLFCSFFLSHFSNSFFLFLRFLYLFSVIFTQRKFPQRTGQAERFRHCWRKHCNFQISSKTAPSCGLI